MIENNYQGHYSHARGLSVNDYVREIMSVNIEVRKNIVNFSTVFDTRVGGLVDNHLKMTIYHETCDSEPIILSLDV